MAGIPPVPAIAELVQAIYFTQQNINDILRVDIL